MKTVIHVNQHRIKGNRKHGRNEPVLTVKTYKSNDYAHEAVILDERGKEVARVVYRPNKPLSCGAHVWIETECRVLTRREMGEHRPAVNLVGAKLDGSIQEDIWVKAKWHEEVQTLFPVGSRVRFEPKGDYDEEVFDERPGSEGRVVGYDPGGSGEWPMVLVRLDGAARPDGFYDDHLEVA
jgi:hypothetical protein